MGDGTSDDGTDVDAELLARVRAAFREFDQDVWIRSVLKDVSWLPRRASDLPERRVAVDVRVPEQRDGEQAPAATPTSQAQQVS